MVRKRVAALSRSLTAEGPHDAEALHQARVASRRLREALAVSVAGGRRRRLQSQVRRLARAIGPVRELDVSLELLAEFDARSDVPQVVLRCLRLELQAQRDALYGELGKRLGRWDHARFRKRALAGARAHARRASRAKSRESTDLATAEAHASARAERLGRTVERAGGLYLPDRLHEVRIAAKKLRYALELLPPSAGGVVQRRITTLTRTQELLGRLHDLEVLITRTRAVQGSGAVRTLALAGDFDRFVRTLETECRMRHAGYVASRRTLLALAAAVVSDARRIGRRRERESRNP